SEGQGQFSVGKLPFDASFYYSDIKNISGLNNYFRVAFDAQKFKQQYADKEAAEANKLKGELGSLYKEKQVAEQKLLYLQNGGGLKTPQAPTAPSTSMPSTSGLQKDATGLEKGVKTDSLSSVKLPNLKADSLSKIGKSDSLNKTGKNDSLSKTSKTDSSSKGGTSVNSQTIKSDSASAAKAANPKSLKSDSAAAAKSVNKALTNNPVVKSADSVKADIQKYESKIEALEKAIAKITNQINSVKHDAANAEHNNPAMGGIANALSGVKKFEIGLCYPDYSTFLLNGMAIKGINLEYYKNEIYLAASQGTTVNTLLFTNNSLQNHLVDMKNLYNMFDFQSVQSGRKVFAIKTGWGEKEGNHIYVGFLYGTGLPSYMDTNSGPVNGLSKNYVLEVDGKWAISKNSSFNLVYAKSSVQTTGNNYDITDGGLISAQHTSAIMGKYTVTIKKTQTKVTLTSRYLDPYFNSFGLGYATADNLRYEIKVEQPLGKKIKVSVFYRKDEDDILDLYQFHTVLQTIGTNTSIKLMRSLTLRIGYTPVVEHMWGDNPTYNIFNNNYICNAVLSFTPTIRNVFLSFNTSYNYYRLTNDTQTIAFQNFSFNSTMRFKNGFSNNLAVSWFRTTPGDSLSNNVWVFEDEVGYAFGKGFSFVIGGKEAYSPLTNNWQTGYLAKIKIPLIKHLSCDITAEKLVIGDFYNSFDIQQIERFPYYIQGRINLTW
ncbi:MAG TPA: hypothetical protein VNZ45_05805, partial [Bacteroidia bacterium]|nr:hypothetical protein [Bacteroidia bacterium]